MKIGLECPECLVHRGFHEIQRAVKDRDRQIKALLKIVKVISENLSENAVPAYIGTLRDRAVKIETGNPDPYKQEKVKSNENALALMRKALEFIKSKRDSYERFKHSCLLSATANLIEFDMLSYNFNFNTFGDSLFKTTFRIDHSREAYSLIKKARSALLLTDNAGEIAFDKLLVETLRDLGLNVIVAVKGAPILNDATLSDAVAVSMTGVAEVITTGTDTVGLILSEASNEFKRKLSEVDLIIAKGMGHYETLTEENIEKPIFYLFVAKCNPVASNVRVKVGEGVLLLSKPR